MSRSPVYLPSDREAWRGLVATARRAAADAAFCRPLGQAARRAFRAVIPAPDMSATFCELVRLGQLWPQMTTNLRRSRMAELIELARAVAIAIGDEPPEDPKPAQNQAHAWTRRADIAG